MYRRESARIEDIGDFSGCRLYTKRLKFMACYSKILNAVLGFLLRNDSKNPIDIRIGTLEFLKNRKTP